MDDALYASAHAAPVEAVPALPVPPREQLSSSLGAAPPASPARESAVSRHQTGALWILLLAFILLLVGPFLVGRFVYEKTYNELKAGYDAATGTLGAIKPRLNDLELASRLVAKRVEPSVVSITRPTGRNLDGQGSGVIVDKAGFIITNFHVVNGTDNVEVRLSDRRVTDGRVVGADAMTDIAVLKIDLDNLVPAEWGDSDKLEVGDLVWALGSPYGLDSSLTFGIVSAKARRSGSYISRSPYQEYLQTDAAVNPGNSGGPLVNIEGQIIGINAAIFGSAYQGISFSIPSAIAKDRYEELKSKGHVDRAWLGILPMEVPDSMRTKLGLGLGEGVYVGTVEADSPAGRVGVHKDDVILKWNDHVANDPTLLSRAIAATEIGSTAKLVLVRADDQQKTELTLEVKVEHRPKDEDER
jgi:serine protease Do